jgi:hypothetical protein
MITFNFAAAPAVQTSNQCCQVADIRPKSSKGP